MMASFKADPYSAPLPYFLGFPCAKDSTWETRYPNRSNAVILTSASFDWFAPWASTSWPQTPQHTNTANGNATNSDKHTNGHGSVGAYNTAHTSPTTRRPPGPELSDDGAAQLLDCTPLQQAPRPTHGPSRCIAQATRPGAAQPNGLHPPPLGPFLW